MYSMGTKRMETCGVSKSECLWSGRPKPATSAPASSEERCQGRAWWQPRSQHPRATLEASSTSQRGMLVPPVAGCSAKNFIAHQQLYPKSRDWPWGRGCFGTSVLPTATQEALAFLLQQRCGDTSHEDAAAFCLRLALGQQACGEVKYLTGPSDGTAPSGGTYSTRTWPGSRTPSIKVGSLTSVGISDV